MGMACRKLRETMTYMCILEQSRRKTETAGLRSSLVILEKLRAGVLTVLMWLLIGSNGSTGGLGGATM